MEGISMTMVGKAISAAKGLKELVKGVDERGLRIPLQDAILDLQEKLLEIQGEIGALQEDNRRLTEALELNEMEFRDDGMYWDGEDGPYCPKCLPTGVKGRVSQDAAGFWVCNACSTSPVSAEKPKRPLPAELDTKHALMPHRLKARYTRARCRRGSISAERRLLVTSSSCMSTNGRFVIRLRRLHGGLVQYDPK